MIDLNKLISKMTIKEKIGQLNLISYNEKTIDKIKSGEAGSIINANGYDLIYTLQEASNESNHKIPLLISTDVIHGYKTIFPIPLGEACSFNMDLIEETAYLSMKEARSEGINWIYAPMIDITNDPRWGRVIETSGEDPYLGQIIASRRVLGIQRKENNQATAACAKHYLGYGAVEAGLDYNTTDFSEHKMRNLYLPPFVAAINSEVMSIMHAFTTYNDLPVTMSDQLLNQVLRKECGFSGILVTDWDCLKQLANQRTVESDSEAAKIGLEVGIDIDMHSNLYHKYLEEWVSKDPELLKKLDQSVSRILTIKEKMGLFENRFTEKLDINIQKRLSEHALKSAVESIILFKNEDDILPLNKDLKILVVGPYNDDRDIHLGAWKCKGNEEDVTSLKEAIEKNFKNSSFFNTPLDTAKTDWEALKKAVKNSDYVLLAIGEPRSFSGENNNRMSIDLPFSQDYLVNFLYSQNASIIGLVLSGRPLAIKNLDNKAKAILWCFHLGTEAANAISKVLTGEEVPSAKTVITFPADIGQIPTYYNRYHTGRNQMLHYVDGDMKPLYPFGYGLSYAKFNYLDFELDFNKSSSELTITLDIENTSNLKASEIVQIYAIADSTYNLRPQIELIGFQKIAFKEHQRLKSNIHLKIDLKLYRKSLTIQVGPSSITGITKKIDL